MGQRDSPPGSGNKRIELKFPKYTARTCGMDAFRHMQVLTMQKKLAQNVAFLLTACCSLPLLPLVLTWSVFLQHLTPPTIPNISLLAVPPPNPPLHLSGVKARLISSF